MKNLRESSPHFFGMSLTLYQQSKTAHREKRENPTRCPRKMDGDTLSATIAMHLLLKN